MRTFIHKFKGWIKEAVEGSAVTSRVALIAVGALIILLVTFVLIDYQIQRNRVVSELEGYSDQFSRAVEGSLSMGMIAMRRDLLQGTIERLTDDSSVVRVQLLNLEGRVTASSQVEAIDTIIPLDSHGCRVCHVSQATPSRRIARIKDPAGADYYRCVRPVLNRKACHRCHDPEQRVNGLLIIDYDAEYLTAQVKDAWQGVAWDMALVTLATLPVLVLLISSTVRRYLLSPMRRLEGLAADIAHGSFPSEIKPELHGDVAQLGDALIDMSRRLEESFEDLRSARDYMNRLSNSIADSLVVIDRNFRVTNVNDSALKLTGSSREDVLFGGCRGVCIIDHDLEICPARVVYREKRPCTVETEVHSEDGRIRWYEVQASPMFDSTGEVSEVVEVIRDITARREMERSLAHSDRLSTMGRLASGVAHEINTPLGTIMASTEGLLRDLERDTGMLVSEWKDLKPYLQTMLGSVQRARQIIQGLLVFVRRGEQTDNTEIELNDIIRNVMEMLKHEPRSAGIHLELNLHEGIPRIKGDHTQLTQVLFNLVQNSLDAVEDHGTITVESLHHDKDIIIAVSDDGAGITEEHGSRIFDPFFTTKPVGEGTGLGLYLCREIVGQYGGTITWNRLPKGTVFRVRLPAGDGVDDG